MLFSLIAQATTLLSGAASWLSDSAGDIPLRANSVSVTPRDPSTLTLALIGIGTIAAYLVLTGRVPRRRDVPAETDRVSDQSEIEREGVDDRPARGAA